MPVFSIRGTFSIRRKGLAIFNSYVKLPEGMLECLGTRREPG